VSGALTVRSIPVQFTFTKEAIDMHELPVTESILNIVLKHAKNNDVKKIVTIYLSVGELSDLEDEWMQKYFQYLSKDTLAKDAKLSIERIPITMQCSKCSNVFTVEKKSLAKIQCPKCKEQKCSLKSGKEYYIKNMEVV
jgi:hydrogenase nickel incorporation protein HypA/HybF